MARDSRAERAGWLRIRPDADSMGPGWPQLSCGDQSAGPGQLVADRWGDHIFLTRRRPKEPNVSLNCFSRQTGSFDWTRQAPGDGLSRSGPRMVSLLPPPSQTANASSPSRPPAARCYDMDGKEAMDHEQKTDPSRRRTATGSSPCLQDLVILAQDQNQTESIFSHSTRRRARRSGKATFARLTCDDAIVVRRRRSRRDVLAGRNGARYDPPAARRYGRSRGRRRK